MEDITDSVVQGEKDAVTPGEIDAAIASGFHSTSLDAVEMAHDAPTASIDDLVEIPVTLSAAQARYAELSAMVTNAALSGFRLPQIVSDEMDAIEDLITGENHA